MSHPNAPDSLASMGEWDGGAFIPCDRLATSIPRLPYRTLLAEGITPLHMGTIDIVSGRLMACDRRAIRYDPFVLRVDPKAHSDGPHRAATALGASRDAQRQALVTGYVEDGALAAVIVDLKPLWREPSEFVLAERCGESRFWILNEGGNDESTILLVDAFHHSELRKWSEERGDSSLTRFPFRGTEPFVDLTQHTGFSSIAVFTRKSQAIAWWGLRNGEPRMLIIDFQDERDF